MVFFYLFWKVFTNNVIMLIDASDQKKLIWEILEENDKQIFLSSLKDLSEENISKSVRSVKQKTLSCPVI